MERIDVLIIDDAAYTTLKASIEASIPTPSKQIKTDAAVQSKKPSCDTLFWLFLQSLYKAG
jgi:hypothetical protein